MEGMEILNTIQVPVEFTSDWWLTIALLLVSIFIGSILGFFIGAERSAKLSILAGALIGAVIGVIFGVISLIATETPTKYETQYQVIIDDTVSMNEFLDNYEIIKREGKIYTIREWR